mmetsp:Transcript_86787/g.281019  ORF Transcript_86787/g.281019 Transcript_86787/m.281019 type:complete len:250 (-) Transcript_86787:553-1302(-)
MPSKGATNAMLGPLPTSCGGGGNAQRRAEPPREEPPRTTCQPPELGHACLQRGLRCRNGERRLSPKLLQGPRAKVEGGLGGGRWQVLQQAERRAVHEVRRGTGQVGPLAQHRGHVQRCQLLDSGPGQGLRQLPGLLARRGPRFPAAREREPAEHAGRRPAALQPPQQGQHLCGLRSRQRQQGAALPQGLQGSEVHRLEAAGQRPAQVLAAVRDEKLQLAGMREGRLAKQLPDQEGSKSADELLRHAQKV